MPGSQSGLDSPLHRVMRSEMMMRSLSFSPGAPPPPPPDLTNNSAATSSMRPRGPLTAVQAAEQPASQAVSHCFLMCFTLPELILAKVLTTPLLSKYAIFWLGTSTIELGGGAPLSSRFFLSFSFFFSFFCKREVCYSRRRANPGVRYVYVSTRRGREGGLSPGRQAGRVATRQIDRQVPFRSRCPRCRQITVYRNMTSGIIRILLGLVVVVVLGDPGGGGGGSLANVPSVVRQVGLEAFQSETDLLENCRAADQWCTMQNFKSIIKRVVVVFCSNLEACGLLQFSKHTGWFCTWEIVQFLLRHNHKKLRVIKLSLSKGKISQSELRFWPMLGIV